MSSFSSTAPGPRTPFRVAHMTPKGLVIQNGIGSALISGGPDTPWQPADLAPARFKYMIHCLKMHLAIFIHEWDVSSRAIENKARQAWYMLETDDASLTYGVVSIIQSLLPWGDCSGSWESERSIIENHWCLAYDLMDAYARDGGTRVNYWMNTLLWKMVFGKYVEDAKPNYRFHYLNSEYYKQLADAGIKLEVDVQLFR